MKSRWLLLLIPAIALTGMVAKPGSNGNVYLLNDPISGNFHFVNQDGADLFVACYAEKFSEGLALVSNLDQYDLRYGFIDQEGKTIIPISYLSASSFSEGLAGVQTSEGHWIYIDKSGNDVHKKKYDDAKPFSGGLAAVLPQGKKGYYGYVNRSGDITISPDFIDAGPFQNGIAIVKTGSGYRYIDQKGKYLGSGAYQFAGEIKKSFAWVGNKDPKTNDFHYGLINGQGQLLTAIEFFLSDGMTPPDLSSGALTVMRKNGFDDYDAIVLDQKGKTIKEFKGATAKPFSNGLALIVPKKYFDKKENSWKGDDAFFINARGEKVFSFTLAQAKDFSNGLAHVLRSNTGTGNEHPYDLIDVKGKVVMEGVDDSYPLGNGSTSFSKQEKWGVVDSLGKVVIPIKYDWIAPFSEGLAFAKLNGQGFYIDQKGTQVISLGALIGKPFMNGVAQVGPQPPEGPDDEAWFYWQYITKDGKILWKPSNKLIAHSLVIKPSNYDPQKKYAVLFAFPPTGGTSMTLMENYLGSMSDKTERQAAFDKLIQSLPSSGSKTPFILVLTPGMGTTADHSAKGFSDCIERYDAYVKEELLRLEKEFSIDRNNMYLTGFSLGGDLSWALNLKNPGMFKGGIVMGSRCSFWKDGSLPVLAKNKARFFIGIGGQEEKVRLDGAKNAKAKIQAAGIEYKYFEIPGGGHEPLSPEQFMEALSFVILR